VYAPTLAAKPPKASNHHRLTRLSRHAWLRQQLLFHTAKVKMLLLSLEGTLRTLKGNPNSIRMSNPVHH
jgi:hypothetical protein